MPLGAGHKTTIARGTVTVATSHQAVALASMTPLTARAAMRFSRGCLLLGLGGFASAAAGIPSYLRARRGPRTNHCALGFILSAVLCIVALGQAPRPDEVRISTRPYRPRHVFHSEVQLVSIETVVRDRSGRPIGALQKQDFRVFDAGKSREIANFDVRRNAVVAASAARSGPTGNIAETRSAPADTHFTPPKRRFVELFFDDLWTQPEDLNRSKVAALRFLNESALTRDEIGLYRASSGQVTEFSLDHYAAMQAVRGMNAHTRVSPSGLSSCPRITPHQAYDIVNMNPAAFQAALSDYCLCTGKDRTQCTPRRPATMGVFTSSNPSEDMSSRSIVMSQAQATWNQAQSVTTDLLASIRDCIGHLGAAPGERIVVLTSSGFLSGGLENEVDRIIGEALHEGVVINALEAKGLYAEAPGRPIIDAQQETTINTDLYETEARGRRYEDYDAPLAQLAESTGGLFFRNNNDLDRGFREIGFAPDISYLLAIKPAEDGKYHKLTVKLTQKAPGETVQARPGYFAPAAADTHRMNASQEVLDAEVVSNESLKQVPVTSTFEVVPVGDSTRQLNIKMAVDVSKLPFQSREGRQNERLTFIAAVFDSSGNAVAGKQAEMNLSLERKTFERLAKEGLTGTLSLGVPNGEFHLRTLVREAVQGKIASETQVLHIN